MEIIIWIIVVFIIFSTVRIVEQNTVLVIQFLWKFNRIMTTGLNFKIPILETVAEKITLRQQNFALEWKYPSGDKVIVDVSTNLIFTVNPTAEWIFKFTYVLQNRQQSIWAIIENSLRTYIAKETHEWILEKKEELALHIRNDLEIQFAEWWMLINSFQITNVNFPVTITNAMSEVVASQQLRKAAENKWEAVKIQAIKEAEGEKERKRLQWEWIALEREAIAEWLQKSVEIVQKVSGQSSTEILSILTLTQYLDTLKTVWSSNNTKVIFMDTSVQKTWDIMSQMMASFEAQKEWSK
ncbi:MAG: hypothetical protein ACD_3C00196G0014 [uncultured bacterium (gcode 4)]|uniref:Band 7 domain-containing protein n=1 Tax=uncultured bacterium (gcode 4) TaxID=1234023 RepID=K2F8P1_9BACT|nr:MAG: hypothetical protein ACD_3C00196G0014 [uncultured bacterium (gcode 4)]